MTAQHIREVAHIDPDVNIWVINPWAIDREIEAIPYIDRAWIHRQLPNRISIEVSERQPESCVQGAQNAMMMIDETERVLESDCHVLPIYTLPALAVHKPGMTLDDPQLTRLRATVQVLQSQGMRLRNLSLDRDNGIVADRLDGVRLLLGDDRDQLEKIRLVAPILAAARVHDPNVEQIDLRAVDTPVVRYRETPRGSQNRPDK